MVRILSFKAGGRRPPLQSSGCASRDTFSLSATIFVVKIEALLFDLGKVLVDLDFAAARDRMASRCELPREQFEQVLRDDSWNRRYECGHISTADYYNHLCEHGGLQMELEEFHESWSS